VKLLYKPIGLIFGVIAARTGKGLYRAIWSRLDKAEPPGPEIADAPMAKVLAARTLEAATMAGVAAVADRAGMRTFQYLFGAWPGQTSAELAKEDQG
jgi:hypothetical protein